MSHPPIRSLATLALLSTLLTGCDATAPPGPEAGLVIEAYLVWPGDAFVVDVSRPVPPGDVPEPIPEPGARVAIGIGEEAPLLMTPDGQVPGRYTLPIDALPLEDDTPYRLSVELDDQRLTAVTYVPIRPTNVQITPDVDTAPLVLDRSEDAFDDVLTLTWALPEGNPTPHLIQVTHPDLGRTFNSAIRWDGEGTVERQAFPEDGVYELCLYRTTDDLVVYDQNRQARRLYVAPSNVEGGFGVFAALHGICQPLTVR
ncbi:MAG: hypothetical protein AAF730_07955 [Bacteroidota bacterium]